MTTFSNSSTMIIVFNLGGGKEGTEHSDNDRKECESYKTIIPMIALAEDYREAEEECILQNEIMRSYICRCDHNNIQVDHK